MNFVEIFDSGVIGTDTRGIVYSTIDDLKFAYHQDTGYLFFNEDTGIWENFALSWDTYINSQEGQDEHEKGRTAYTAKWSNLGA